MPGFDLHTHTVLSDGTTTPEENVRAAVALGLDGLGVTDHDTTAPFERAQAAADGTGLELILGTEFSAELGGTSVHLLAYWIDPTDPALQVELDRIRNERARRAEQIVAKFNAIGIPITYERVTELAGAAPIGRPHIAAAVIETGAATETREVFDRWLHDGGPVYVEKYAVDPVRGVALLRGAGAAVVLAHPGLYGRDDQGLDELAIAPMVEAGLAGVEAAHPSHTPADVERYVDLARRFDLLQVQGSDFHGERKDLQLGSATTARAEVDALRARRP